MFSAPQYNTWIEMPYQPTQDGVLAYVRGVLEAGFLPGLLMIDDRWSVDYGNWTFDRARFPDQTAMNRQLHELGFSTMVSLVPFVSPDSANSRTAARRRLLITGTGCVKRCGPCRRWGSTASSSMPAICATIGPTTSPSAPGSDRPPVQLPGHDRRRGNLLVPERRATGSGTVRPVRPVLSALSDDEFSLARGGCWTRRTWLPSGFVSPPAQLIGDLGRLLDQPAATGEPILRPLAHEFPGYETVHDQFLLGADLLVAPVLRAGVTSRAALIPPGRWRSVGPAIDDAVLDGPTEVDVSLTLDSLPVWRRE